MAGAVVLASGSVVGDDTVVLAGAPIRAAHVHLDLRLSGDNQGTQTQDRWFDVRNGLLLHDVTDLDVQAASPFGRVHYDEHYDLDLTSTVSQR